MNNETIPYPIVIIDVLMHTPLTQALEEVGSFVQEEHLVSSTTPTFNIFNLIKMRLVSPKHYIRPNGDAKRTTSQGRGFLAPPSEVDDSVAPIFTKDNK